MGSFLFLLLLFCVEIVCEKYQKLSEYIIKKREVDGNSECLVRRIRKTMKMKKRMNNTKSEKIKKIKPTQNGSRL